MNSSPSSCGSPSSRAGSTTETWTVVVLLCTALASVIIMAVVGPPALLFVLGLAGALLIAFVLLAFSSSTRTTERLSAILLSLGITCFVLTIAQELVLHGTALNGGVRDGQFFVGSHGHYHRVSEQTYRLALLPNLGMIVSWPSLMAISLFRSITGRRGHPHRP
jgi:hypothetical protein